MASLYQAPSGFLPVYYAIFLLYTVCSNTGHPFPHLPCILKKATHLCLQQLLLSANGPGSTGVSTLSLGKRGHMFGWFLEFHNILVLLTKITTKPQGFLTVIANLTIIIILWLLIPSGNFASICYLLFCFVL